MLLSQQPHRADSPLLQTLRPLPFPLLLPPSSLHRQLQRPLGLLRSLPRLLQSPRLLPLLLLPSLLLVKSTM